MGITPFNIMITIIKILLYMVAISLMPEDMEVWKVVSVSLLIILSSSLPYREREDNV